MRSWKRAAAMAVVICVLAGTSGCALFERLLGPARNGIVCQWDEDGALDCAFRFEADA